MNSKVLQTLEKGYIRFDWSEYIHRVNLHTEHLITIVEMINNFKANRGAKELIIFRFKGIPAYVMIEKMDYPLILEWIKTEFIQRECYENCKMVVDLINYFKSKKNVRLKRNS